MMKNTKELIKKLTQIPAVSGTEENITKALCELLSEYGELQTDSMNNVFCTFGEGYHFLLDAHIDEIGLVVTEITDDGFIKADRCGGADRRILPASEVSVWGTKEIKGIISTLPPHLQSSSDEKKVMEFKEISIDTGLSCDELKKYVSLGDRITFKKNYTELLNNRISASCLDDRSGVCAILLALDRLKELPCKITVMLSSQEELGTRGAKIGPYAKKVDEAISIDVSFAYSPSCDKADCGELSKGPMIGFSPILNREMSNMLVKIAEDKSIPYQREIMSGSTGTNADVISLSESGIKTALISIPERYMHQSVEVVDIEDIENTAELIYNYILERAGEMNA